MQLGARNDCCQACSALFISWNRLLNRKRIGSVPDIALVRRHQCVTRQKVAAWFVIRYPHVRLYLFIDWPLSAPPSDKYSSYTAWWIAALRAPWPVVRWTTWLYCHPWPAATQGSWPMCHGIRGGSSSGKWQSYSTTGKTSWMKCRVVGAKRNACLATDDV